MSTDTIWRTVSSSSEQTEQLGEKLGAKLRGGEIIELISDVGGGKTTLTRGLVRGAGSMDKVASPTFTISKEYRTPKFTIAHFDFYRLQEAGIVADELAEIVEDPAYVAVIEWGEIVHDVLAGGHVRITLAQTPIGDRTITCQYPESLNYMFEGLA